MARCSFVWNSRAERREERRVRVEVLDLMRAGAEEWILDQKVLASGTGGRSSERRRWGWRVCGKNAEAC